MAKIGITSTGKEVHGDLKPSSKAYSNFVDLDFKEASSIHANQQGEYPLGSEAECWHSEMAAMHMKEYAKRLKLKTPKHG